MRDVCNDTGKIIFSNEAEARSAIACMRQSLKFKTPDGKRIKHRQRKMMQKRVYYCSSCGGYHLTKWTRWPYLHEKNTSTQNNQYENKFIV